MIKKIITVTIFALYFIFIIGSFFLNFSIGKSIGGNFLKYALDMLMMFPFVFILIGLFEVWIKKETIEKHLGERSGAMGFFWAVLLGGTTFGPMLVALPIAYSLFNKGAKLSIVFTYIGAASVCRIPMTIFEASYMGAKFTIIRYAVSIPLIILFSVILGKYLTGKNYEIKDDK